MFGLIRRCNLIEIAMLVNSRFEQTGSAESRFSDFLKYTFVRRWNLLDAEFAIIRVDLIPRFVVGARPSISPLIKRDLYLLADLRIAIYRGDCCDFVLVSAVTTNAARELIAHS